MDRQNGTGEMIPVKPVAEPVEFDTRVRQPGKTWLAQNPEANRPRDYWSLFRDTLAEGFAGRCGYTAMYVPSGTVDHYRSWKTHPELAYEWSNYRYAEFWANCVKKTREVLDPYEVGEGWFEVLLPSLQLVPTSKVPHEHRAIVEQTLRVLPIAHDERVIRLRRRWYDMYLQGELTLEGLRKVAPLIAAAVEKNAAKEAGT